MNTRQRLRAVFLGLRREREADFERELRSHLDLEAEEQFDAGLPPEEARYAARRLFGNTALVKEEVREMWGWTWLEWLAQDLRYGLRTLWRAKWISGAAVATLAPGIGANTALFSVVYTVLLRSLPFPDSGRLVMLAQRDPHSGATTDCFADTRFFDWRSQNHSFDSMAAVETVPDVQMTFGGRTQPVQLTGEAVSASFLDVLGLRPVLGRDFGPEQDFPNRNHVALLSYAVWQRRFGGSEAALGAGITIDGFPFTVIGVLPADFEFLSSPSFLVPLARDPSARWTRGRELQIVARLRPGASVEQAEADLTALTRRLERDGPPILTGMGTEAKLTPLIHAYVGEVRPALLVLLGAVLCVLLIACANVTNLLLARATTRQREMAVRVSLGASRGRLLRQLLTESLVLTGIGGLLGVLVAWWGAQLLMGLVPASMPIPRLDQLHPNLAILAFTLSVTVATAFLVGLIPAFQASREDVALAMRPGGRALGGGRRLRGSLVALEIALAAVLLIAAGLLLRTFAYLRHIDPGFSGRNVLACHLKLPDAQYRTGEQQSAFFAQVLDRARSLPGVRSAAAIDGLPVSGAGGGTWVHVEGRPEPPPGQEVNVMVRTITPGYFSTLGVPFCAGRDFTDADAGVLDISKPVNPATSPLKLIVNQALVDRLLPCENPPRRAFGDLLGSNAGRRNRRRGWLRPLSEPGRGSGTRLLLARVSAAPRRHVPRGPHRRAALGLGGSGSRRGPLGRYERTRRRGGDSHRSHLTRQFPLALQPGFAESFCWHRVDSGSGGIVRCEGLRRGTAHAGDRSAYGARRKTGWNCEDGSHGGYDARRRWSGGWRLGSDRSQ